MPNNRLVADYHIRSKYFILRIGGNGIHNGRQVRKLVDRLPQVEKSIRRKGPGWLALPQYTAYKVGRKIKESAIIGNKRLYGNIRTPVEGKSCRQPWRTINGFHLNQSWLRKSSSLPDRYDNGDCKTLDEVI